jgi:prepilin-type N-terminal cleavage/methylation domain-containing protein
MKAVKKVMMPTRRYLNKALADQGFSLVEVTIALTTLGICMAYAMPLFLYSKINNIKSEVRTGSLMVSQQIFDDLRGVPFKNIPKVATNPASPTSTIISRNGYELTAATSESIPKNEYKVMGRLYTANVFYCETPATTTNECGDNYKKFRVEVKDNKNQPVYEMEVGLTNFR